MHTVAETPKDLDQGASKTTNTITNRFFTQNFTAKPTAYSDPLHTQSITVSCSDDSSLFT
jgi:hypothetical protein